jgi:hypothetical protein
LHTNDRPEPADPKSPNFVSHTTLEEPIDPDAALSDADVHDQIHVR